MRVFNNPITNFPEFVFKTENVQRFFTYAILNKILKSWNLADLLTILFFRFVFVFTLANLVLNGVIVIFGWFITFADFGNLILLQSFRLEGLPLGAFGC